MRDFRVSLQVFCKIFIFTGCLFKIEEQFKDIIKYDNISKMICESCNFEGCIEWQLEKSETRGLISNNFQIILETSQNLHKNC